MKRFVRFFTAVVYIGLSTCVGTQAYAQHHAHVHGVGELNIVVEEEGRLVIEFDSPMYNLVGFEHAPQTPAQLQALADLKSRLYESTGTLFMPTPEAHCQIETVNLESALLEQEEAKEAQEMHHHQHSHADLEALFVFHCARPESLHSLDVLLLHVFGGLERLDVQLVTPHKQSAATLDSDHSQLTW